MAPNRRLRQARELRGWSQAKVAGQIGTDATTVSRWERGLFAPTPYFREKLCVLFGKNAEDLGLLETTDWSTPALPSLQLSGVCQRDDLSTSSVIAPAPPSWPKRTDTFTYILHSAVHDQQAHMLWEDAYIRAMRGQLAEAQQLGEASLSAFERVGHMNAIAIREWLNQHDLTSPHVPPANVSPTSLPIPSEQHKQSAKPVLQGKGASIALILLIVAICVATFAFSQLYSPGQASTTSVVHASSAPKIASQVQSPTAQIRGTTTLPAAAPTPGRTVATPASGLSARVAPTHLTLRDCPQESLGYRCTVSLWAFPDGQTTFTWRASSPDLPATFNPSAGTGTAGQPVQVIIYLQSSPGQSGQLVFTFTSATKTSTVYVSWQG
jgi:transcriptional regulator with XRE-family HTH domain